MCLLLGDDSMTAAHGVADAAIAVLGVRAGNVWLSRRPQCMAAFQPCADGRAFDGCHGRSMRGVFVEWEARLAGADERVRYGGAPLNGVLT